MHFLLFISMVSILISYQAMASSLTAEKSGCQFLENTSWHGAFEGGDYRTDIRIKFGKIEKTGDMYRIVDGSINTHSIAKTGCFQMRDKIWMGFSGIANVAIAIEYAQNDASGNKIRSVRLQRLNDSGRSVFLFGDLLRD